MENENLNINYETFESNFGDFANATKVACAALETPIILDSVGHLCTYLKTKSNTNEFESIFYFVVQDSNSIALTDQLLSVDNAFLLFVDLQISIESPIKAIKFNIIRYYTHTNKIVPDSEDLQKQYCNKTFEPTSIPSNQPTLVPVIDSNTGEQQFKTDSGEDWIEDNEAKATVISLAIICLLFCICAIIILVKCIERNEKEKQAREDEIKRASLDNSNNNLINTNNTNNDSHAIETDDTNNDTQSEAGNPTTNDPLTDWNVENPQTHNDNQERDRVNTEITDEDAKMGQMDVKSTAMGVSRPIVDRSNNIEDNKDETTQHKVEFWNRDDIENENDSIDRQNSASDLVPSHLRNDYNNNNNKEASDNESMYGPGSVPTSNTMNTLNTGETSLK